MKKDVFTFAAVIAALFVSLSCFAQDGKKTSY